MIAPFDDALWMLARTLGCGLASGDADCRTNATEPLRFPAVRQNRAVSSARYITFSRWNFLRAMPFARDQDRVLLLIRQ
jgi:hypothetical protein